MIDSKKGLLVYDDKSMVFAFYTFFQGMKTVTKEGLKFDHSFRYFIETLKK